MRRRSGVRDRTQTAVLVTAPRDIEVAVAIALYALGLTAATFVVGW